MIPPVSGVPAQPNVAFPPVSSAGRPAAPMAPPVYGMPMQPPSMTPQAPAMPAPPATPLNMPATYVPTSRPGSSNVTLYVILGALFMVALFLVIFLALKS
jgi:hypothetical protein